MPHPMRRQLPRCAGEALRKRGNHSSGAETRRASASVTINSSSVNATSTASARGLLAKVLIPSQNKRFAILLNQIVKSAQFGTAKAAGFRETDGDEPELRIAPCLFAVDVSNQSVFTPLVIVCYLGPEKPKHPKHAFVLLLGLHHVSFKGISNRVIFTESAAFS